MPDDAAYRRVPSAATCGGAAMSGLVSVTEARSFVTSSCRRLDPVEVGIGEALGLVLAETVRSRGAVPPFANSSMDGYAVRAVDVENAPTRLKVVGTLMAGDNPGSLTVGDGEAVRIMTGAVMPRGADSVCMVERTRDEDGWVVIEEPVTAGTYVRLPGEDIEAGAEVFGEGVVLRPAHVGVLASLGVERARVYPRARVGVLSTGDELVDGPGPLPPGKIRDSNGPALVARLTADGFVPVDLGRAGDEPAAFAESLQEAVRRCDAVLTSGGVSVGDRDVVRIVLEKLGGPHARWLQVAVRPGKPFAFSTLPPNGAPVFGLPGNPVSSLVSYELFARPSLRLMSGHTHLERPRLRATAEVDIRRQPDGRLHMVRVCARADDEGALLVRPSGGQGSHQLTALADANALAAVPDGTGILAGETVDIMVLDPDEVGPAG